MGDSSRWDAEVSADEADEADAWDNLLGPSADRQRRERDRALLAVDLRLSDTRLSAPGRRRAHRSANLWKPGSSDGWSGTVLARRR